MQVRIVVPSHVFQPGEAEVCSLPHAGGAQGKGIEMEAGANVLLQAIRVKKGAHQILGALLAVFPLGGGKSFKIKEWFPAARDQIAASIVDGVGRVALLVLSVVPCVGAHRAPYLVEIVQGAGRDALGAILVVFPAALLDSLDGGMGQAAHAQQPQSQSQYHKPPKDASAGGMGLFHVPSSNR